MNNEQAKRVALYHLQEVYNFANGLNGAYGEEAAALMKLYGEIFNNITLKLLPSLGMSEEEITDIVSSLDESYWHSLE